MQAMDVRILTDRQLRSEIETLRKTLIMTKEFLWDEGEEIKNILGGLVREQSRRLSKFMQTERGPLYGQPPPPPRPPPRQWVGAPPPPPPKPYQTNHDPHRDSWGSASSPRSSSSSAEESLGSVSNEIVVHDSRKVESPGKPTSSRAAGIPASDSVERSQQSASVTRARLLAERLDDVLSTVSDGLSPHERDVIIRSLTERCGDDGGVKYDVPPAPPHSSKAQQAYRTHPDAPKWDQIPHNSQAYHVDVQRDNQDWEREYHQGGYHHQTFQNWRYNGPPPPPPPGPPPPPPPGPPPPPPPGPPPPPPPLPPPPPPSSKNLQMSPGRYDDHFSCGPASALEGERTPMGSEVPDFMCSCTNDFYAEWDDEDHTGGLQLANHPVAHHHHHEPHTHLELDTAMRAACGASDHAGGQVAEGSNPPSPLPHPGSAVGGAAGTSKSMRSEQYLDSMLYKSSLSSNSGLCTSWAMNSAAAAARDMSTTDSWWGSKMGNSSQQKGPALTSQSTTPKDMRIDDTADMQFIVNSRYSSETDLAYPSPTKDDSSKAQGAALKSFKLLPQTLTNFFRNRSCKRKTAV